MCSSIIMAVLVKCQVSSEHQLIQESLPLSGLFCLHGWLSTDLTLQLCLHWGVVQPALWVTGLLSCANSTSVASNATLRRLSLRFYWFISDQERKLCRHHTSFSLFHVWLGWRDTMFLTSILNFILGLPLYNYSFCYRWIHLCCFLSRKLNICWT